MANGESKVETLSAADKSTEVSIFERQQFSNKNTAEDNPSAVFSPSVI